MKLSIFCLVSLAPILAAAQTQAPERFVGDIGGMVTTSQSILSGA